MENCEKLERNIGLPSREYYNAYTGDSERQGIQMENMEKKKFARSSGYDGVPRTIWAIKNVLDYMRVDLRRRRKMWWRSKKRGLPASTFLNKFSKQE